MQFALRLAKEKSITYINGSVTFCFSVMCCSRKKYLLRPFSATVDYIFAFSTADLLSCK